MTLLRLLGQLLKEGLWTPAFSLAQDQSLSSKCFLVSTLLPKSYFFLASGVNDKGTAQEELGKQCHR